MEKNDAKLSITIAVIPMLIITIGMLVMYSGPSGPEAMYDNLFLSMVVGLTLMASPVFGFSGLWLAICSYRSGYEGPDVLLGAILNILLMIEFVVLLKLFD